jgi:hypothetical protein
MDVDEKFTSFMQSFAAAVELNARAMKEGCFVECVVLSASVIDATLRMGLILKHQLATSSSELVEAFLYQGEEDKMISERQIYKESLAKLIIGQATFDKLNTLYAQRNKVVHRYVISQIKTSDVLDLAMEYEEMQHRVSDFVAVLEKEQIRLGIGMTVEEVGEDATQQIVDLATGKHGNDLLADALRNGL